MHNNRNSKCVSAFLAALIFAQPASAQIKPGFGVGVVHLGGKARVDEASLVNGLVRVDRDSNTSIRPMVDVHAPVIPISENITAGPFVGVQFSTAQVVDSLGAGMMISLPTGGTAPKTLNLGIGAVLDPNVRTLGNGIEEDQPLPPGETSIRFRNTSKFGVFFMTSVGF
jgi:hypothetical protein